MSDKEKEEGSFLLRLWRGISVTPARPAIHKQPRMVAPTAAMVAGTPLPSVSWRQGEGRSEGKVLAFANELFGIGL